ncbi:MAG: hypothetical protein KAW14_09210 [Candidatus Aegiribacteria sp.]|nr:hypothetical protein [Candidatus Aegiribacteria sp.]
MILIGCGSDETPPELPLIEYKFVITDSIGVEIGDPNYILGLPLSPAHSPEGNIAFVDKMKHTAFMFTPDGEFIRSIGRKGKGPGEFHFPWALSFYSDGSLLISDPYAITLFDSNCEYQNEMTWTSSAPSLIVALDSGGFIGLKTEYLPSENGIITILTLAHWDGNEEPSVEYFSIESEWIIEQVIDNSKCRDEDLICCASRNGRVFYSQSSIDEFVIHGCELDGTPFLHIEDESVYRVRKSEDELRTEMDDYVSFINMITGNAPGANTDIKLDPYKRTMLGMFIDGEERLWVRLGCYPGVVFRVYDMSGEILFHAMVEYNGNPVDLNSWEITGDEHGFFGINTSHAYWQRIYMLTLTEAE